MPNQIAGEEFVVCGHYIYGLCMIAQVADHFTIPSRPSRVIFCDVAEKATQLKCQSHHKEDFSISAKWHFSATSHGKGACDNLERMIK